MNEKQKYYVSLALLFIGFGVLVLALFSVNYMPFKQKLLILSVVTMASMGLLIITKTRFWRAFSGILLIFVSIYFVSSQRDLIEIAQSNDYEVVDYNLLSLDNKDIETQKVGIFGVRAEHHEVLLDELPINTEFVNYENMDLLAMDLKDHIIKSFIITDNLIPNISVSPSLSDFEFKELNQFSIQVNHKTEAKRIDLFKDPYLIYVSGIDVEGNALTRSESDMNFVLAINPNTNTMLTVDVPKDTYLRLACYGNKMDAIKNSGLYGIDCSMGTLEQYLQIEFNYYLRINLAGTERLVDALDGIDVYSDKDFIGDNDTEFTKGYNNLNGKEALEYIRKQEEMVDVSKGDNSKHRYLLEAVMNKMLNEKNIYSLPQHLSVLKNVLDTNLTNRDLSKIISDQISKKHNWDTIEVGLRGYSDMQQIYTDKSSDKHFIYWPGDGSKREIKEMIEKVMEHDEETIELKTFY